MRNFDHSKENECDPFLEIAKLRVYDLFPGERINHVSLYEAKEEELYFFYPAEKRRKAQNF